VNWSTESIADESFRARFVTVPSIIESWTSDYQDLADSTVMDFGCGEGITALGLALRNRAPRVVGIDIMPDPERCLPVASRQIGLDALPPNLTLHRVTPGSLHNAGDTFDLIYSWSVFEHVDERLLDGALQLIHAALKKNGLFLLQIAPLYYSAEGSHLVHKTAEPWGHLLSQHNAFHDRLCAAEPDADQRLSLWSTYRTLNRITAPELLDRMKGNGFEILRTYTTRDALDPPARLKAIFNVDVLTTNQVAVLARPARRRFFT
jgi:SAM-dependent methyltransferase